MFVAAWPTDEAVAALNALLDVDDEPGIRPVPEQNWHVTLRFLGQASVDEVRAALSGADLPPARARLGPVIERLGPRQIVVPASGVDELARAVRSATVDLGAPDRHPFRGHLTIARTKPKAPSRLVGLPFVAEFEIAEIALVESELRPTGAVYTTVARVAIERGDITG